MSLRKFLVFGIQDVEYAVDIAHVKGVRVYTTPSKTPNLPSVISGFIVEQDVEIPVVDTRMMLIVQHPVIYSPSGKAVL